MLAHAVRVVGNGEGAGVDTHWNWISFPYLCWGNVRKSIQILTLPIILSRHMNSIMGSTNQYIIERPETAAWMIMAHLTPLLLVSWGARQALGVTSHNLGCSYKGSQKCIETTWLKLLSAGLVVLGGKKLIFPITQPLSRCGWRCCGREDNHYSGCR